MDMDQAVMDQKLESLRHCVLRLTRSIQICVDVDAHGLGNRSEYGAPQTMDQEFNLLAEAGKLDEALLIRLRKSRGLAQYRGARLRSD